MTKQQREMLLRQQMRAIQEELGETDEAGAETELLRERFDKAALPEEVRKEAERELKRLTRLPQASPETNVVRNYLEVILELPWNQSSEAVLDLAHARKVLDEESLRRAKVNNPVLMLDEIDKLGRDFRGDPASAMLEILDPEQNDTFRDNYLDMPFDLSSVFFITTANSLDTIPQPLLDRMEVLSLTGYSEEEKLAIVKKYLVPRQLEQSGVRADQCELLDETLERIIRRYTREAGLRQLERVIGRVMRRVAVGFAEGSTEAVKVSPDDLTEMLGPERFHLEKARKDMPPGVVAGLAWTPSGGDVLYIESTLLPGGSRPHDDRAARRRHAGIRARCAKLPLVARRRFRHRRGAIS